MQIFIKEFLYFTNLIPKKQIIFFVLSSLSVLLLDLLGIISVGAFVSILVDGENSRIFILTKSYVPTWALAGEQYIIFFSLFLLISFFFKTIFYCFVQKKILYISKFIETKVVSLLSESYIRKPYEHFMKEDRAYMENLIFNGVIVHFVLQGGFDFLLGGMVLFSVFSFLIYFYPLISIAFVCFFLCGSFYYFYLIKSKVKIKQKDFIKHNTNFIRSLKDVFLSFKEVKIYSREDYFVKRIGSSLKYKNNALRSQYLYQMLPRYFLEFFLILFIVISTLVLFYFHSSTKNTLSSLGILAASFSRALPLINSLLSSFLKIKGYRVMFSSYYREIKELVENKKKTKAKDLSKENKKSKFSKIVLNDLHYAYPTTQITIFQRLSLEITKNECIGIIGDSGSGKSTFVDLFSGILSPQKGVISIDGESVCKDIKAWRSNFAYIPQSTLLINNTICKNVALGIEEEDIDREKVKEALSLAGILDFVTSLPLGIDEKVGENGLRVSGGQRQRIALARAFYEEKSILILDEATSALDPKTEDKIFETLGKVKDKTIIIVSHNYKTLKQCQRIFEVKNKTLVELKGEFSSKGKLAVEKDFLNKGDLVFES